MNIHNVIGATLALATLSGVARGDALQPIEARSLDLGTVSGVAYYTVEREGLRVIATLSQPGESTTPVRVEALLGPGQRVIISTPHEVGVAPELVEISRQADTVLIRKLSGAVTN
jgi:hypothetical protein